LGASSQNNLGDFIMGWFERLFGAEPLPEPPTPEAVEAAPQSIPSIPAAKIGPDGNFDESGLAKRVVIAFDNDPEVADIETVWVAQLSGVVVLQGRVPSQEILAKLVAIAQVQNGATGVKTDEVTIG
jgi:hypothetical protein